MTGNGQPIHVESHGQKGGITAGIINITALPQARISLYDQTHTITDAGHQYEAIVNIESQVTIPKVLIVARGHSVEALNVLFQGTGIQRSRTGEVEGHRAIELMNPEPGRYKITVVTREAEDISIDATVIES